MSVKRPPQPWQVDIGKNWVRAYRFLEAPGGPAIDVTGWSARLHVRDNDDNLIISAESPTEITIGTDDGYITVNIPAADTASVQSGCYFFDLEVTYADATTQTFDSNKVVVRTPYTHD